MQGRHLIGIAGRAAGDAKLPLRSSLAAIGIDQVATAGADWFSVAFGPAGDCTLVDDEASCMLVAGTLLREKPSRPSPTHAGTEQAVLADTPVGLRFEGTVLAADAATRSGYVARDHLGHGSLYWTALDGCVAFATELRLLLSVLRRRPSPDPVAIALWLGLDSTRTDLSFYEGVHQVPAGHRLWITPDAVRVEPYWRPVYAPPEAWSIDEAVDTLRGAVVQAVERRLPERGRTGVLMSGGVDSASVAAFTHSVRPDVVAYSDVFPTAPEVDETRWIDEIVRHLGIESVRSAVEPAGVVLDLIEFIERWSTPPESANYWSQPLLAQAASDGVTTLFTGEGGDELFAVRSELIADSLRGGHVLGAYRLARTLPRMLLYPSPRQLLAALWTFGVENAFPVVAGRLRRRSPDPEPSWLAPGLSRLLRAARDDGAWARLDGPRWWQHAAYDLTTRVPAVGVPSLVRRTGEAAGCLACSPLLDVDLAENALRCPPELAFNGVVPKPLLRAAARGYLPDSVRLRRGKSSFMRMAVDGVGGADFPLISSLLHDPGAEIRAYVDRSAMVRDLLEHRPDGYGAAAGDWAFRLYRLVALECWLRRENDPGSLARLQDDRGTVAREFTIHHVRPSRDLR